MAEAAPLARRTRARLADLPAQPLYGLAPLIPATGPRAVAVLRPAGSGRVIAEALGGTLVAVLEVEGELRRPLALARSSLLTLARRHPKAERMAVDAPAPQGEPLLRLAVMDATSSAALLCPEAAACDGTVRELLQDPPLLGLGDAQAALIDPVLIAQAVAAMRRLCPGPALVSLPDHDMLGLLLRGRPADAGPVLAATVAVVRMLAAD